MDPLSSILMEHQPALLFEYSLQPEQIYSISACVSITDSILILI